MSTSEEFLQGAVNNFECLTNSDVEKRDLNETKVPLNCTNKDGESAFETMTEDFALSEDM